MFIDYLFEIAFGFVDVLSIIIFVWKRICLKSGFVVGPFRDVSEVFNGL